MNRTSPQPFVFVLMPFDKDFDDVYQLGIKPACEMAGAYAERVDEQIFHESILQRIYNQISKADVIISDMSGRNPNVFYETGYAHALGKPVILLTRINDDIPFDLKHFAHIIYEGRISDLIPELVKRVAFAIEKPKEALNNIGVDIYLGKTLLKPHCHFHLPVPDNSINGFSVSFDFHNPINTRIKSASFQIGFLCPDIIDWILYEGSITAFFKTYKQPDGTLTLHLSSKKFHILPGSWENIALEVHFEDGFKKDEIINIILRLFSNDGIFDFPFSLKGLGETPEQ